MAIIMTNSKNMGFWERRRILKEAEAYSNKGEYEKAGEVYLKSGDLEKARQMAEELHQMGNVPNLLKSGALYSKIFKKEEIIYKGWCPPSTHGLDCVAYDLYRKGEFVISAELHLNAKNVSAAKSVAKKLIELGHSNEASSLMEKITIS